MAASSLLSPRTRFMCAIHAPDMTAERLRKMNIEETAKHYGIDTASVAFERAHCLKMRGEKA